MGSSAAFEPHAGRGRFNAAFFKVMDGYINWHLRDHKARVFADLPQTVVELGSGVGANLRYLPQGGRLVAIEPNPHMHSMLAKAAMRNGVELEIRDVVGERIDLPDDSVETVISSLVLCTVSDPAQVLAEVRRILRPGGRYAYVEHVAAREGTLTRGLQRVVRRPWAWVFEGCSCERNLEAVLESSGFAEVHSTSYRIHSPLVPFNTQIAGYAIA
ncbi:MAG: class I SAM-dependent methyltransferase [Acidimicrobiales bacterium]